MEDILDIDEVAGILRISPSAVYKMAGSGTLPAFKVGKQWRFRRSNINAWVDAQSGLTARGFEVAHPAARMDVGLTPEQYRLLEGIWVRAHDQFIDIARRQAGRLSLSRLLGIPTERVKEVAEALEQSPRPWPVQGPEMK